MSIYKNNVNHAHFSKVIFFIVFLAFYYYFALRRNSTLTLIVRALTPFNFIRLQATI